MIESMGETPVPRSTRHSLTYPRESMRRRRNTVAPRGHSSRNSLGKSRPLRTGVTRCGGSATSPPPPGPVPPLPFPVPVPTPPAPVPGPRTSDAPCVGAAPWRGVSVAAIFCTGGVSIRGFGATTEVAWLLMFLGDDPPAFNLGLGWWRRRGGGGGGVSLRLSMLRARCVSPISTFPDMFRNANRSAAWMAITAAIAPLLSRLLTSVR